MHQNSLDLMADFVQKYRIRGGMVVDIGSLDMNGNYRSLFPDSEYIGVDIVEGRNVDILMDSEEWKKLKNADVVICGQTLEHVADIPELMKSIFNVLRPGGLLCMIAPSAGPPHDYPIWVGHFSVESMSEIISKAGFDIFECSESAVEPFRDVRCVAAKKIRKEKN